MSQSTPADRHLADLREEIEEIDRELVETIAQRTYVASAVADAQDERGLPTTIEAQERAVTERADVTAADFDLDPNLVNAISQLLIEVSKVEQRGGSR